MSIQGAINRSLDAVASASRTVKGIQTAEAALKAKEYENMLRDEAAGRFPTPISYRIPGEDEFFAKYAETMKVQKQEGKKRIAQKRMTHAQRVKAHAKKLLEELRGGKGK